MALALLAQAVAPFVLATLCALPVLGATTYLAVLAKLAPFAALHVLTTLHAPLVLGATTYLGALVMLFQTNAPHFSNPIYAHPVPRATTYPKVLAHQCKQAIRVQQDSQNQRHGLLLQLCFSSYSQLVFETSSTCEQS